MPQSSILGWLTKRSDIPEPPSTKQSNSPIKRDALPTPPPSSQEDIPSALNVSSQSKANPLESGSINLNRPLPPNVELRACKKEDIAHLKQITSLLLPIPYPENFYREILDDPVVNNITLLAFWHPQPKSSVNGKGRLIGAIRCKILDPPSPASPPTIPTSNGPMLYLSTLVLLSPYRGQGIATQMLDLMTRRAVNDHGVTSVGAHVWEANLDALEWYRKRGFSELRREEGYYRRLTPQGAVVMQRRVGVMDLVGG